MTTISTKISVTQRDINIGKGDVMVCPIDRACKRHLKKNVSPMMGSQTLYLFQNGKSIEVKVPQVATDFVAVHDQNWMDASPVKFKLEIPATLLRAK